MTLLTFGNLLKFGPDSCHNTKGRPTFLHWERESTRSPAQTTPHTTHAHTCNIIHLGGASNGPPRAWKHCHSGWLNEGPRWRRWFFTTIFRGRALTRVYIVLVKVCEKTYLKSSSREFHGSSRLGLSHEIQLGKDSSNSSMCFTRGLFVGWHSQASCELIVNSSSLQNLQQSFTHSPYIKSDKNTGKWLNRIIIKFDMEL